MTFNPESDPLICPHCSSTSTVWSPVRDRLRASRVIARLASCDDCNHVWLIDCSHCLKLKNKGAP